MTLRSGTAWRGAGAALALAALAAMGLAPPGPPPEPASPRAEPLVAGPPAPETAPSVLVPMRGNAYLPPAEARGDPLRLAGDAPAAPRDRPLADVPPLGSDPSMPTGGRRRLAVGPPVRVESPAAGLLDGLPSEARVAAYRMAMALGQDPAADPARDVLLTPVRGLRETGVPLLRLVIPDPFELPEAVRLATPPADADPPASWSDLPPRPALPVNP